MAGGNNAPKGGVYLNEFSVADHKTFKRVPIIAAERAFSVQLLVLLWNRYALLQCSATWN